MDRAGEVSSTPGRTAAPVTQHAALVSCCYSTATAMCKLETANAVRYARVLSGQTHKRDYAANQSVEIYWIHGSFNLTNKHKWFLSSGHCCVAYVHACIGMWV